MASILRRNQADVAQNTDGPGGEVLQISDRRRHDVERAQTPFLHRPPLNTRPESKTASTILLYGHNRFGRFSRSESALEEIPHDGAVAIRRQ